jgi:transcriptional regulator with XRE-family HTH domain
LTQAALAEQLGTTPLVIARIERGQHQVDEGNRRQIVQALAGSSAAAVAVSAATVDLGDAFGR